MSAGAVCNVRRTPMWSTLVRQNNRSRFTENCTEASVQTAMALDKTTRILSVW